MKKVFTSKDSSSNYSPKYSIVRNVSHRSMVILINAAVINLTITTKDYFSKIVESMSKIGGKIIKILMT